MRYAAEVSYNGALFCGWQIQDGQPSVQDAVQKALSLLNGAQVKINGAGRTDAGVHARGQVCSFDMAEEWEPRRLLLAVNANLPEGISFMKAAHVHDDFHAQYDAVSREYVYFMWTGLSVYPHMSPYVCHIKGSKYDWGLAAEACRYLEGRHDFRCFCRTPDVPDDSVRTIYRARLRRRGNLMWLRIKGSGFLTNMVRNILGDLELVALKKRPPEWINELFSEDMTRNDGGRTFGPNGLFLWKIEYDPCPWK